MPPSPSKPRTLYQMVIDDILASIRSGAFSFDQPICTESKLMERLGVSRITARRAMTELENRGVLYRKRGVGSFVSRDIYQISAPPASVSRVFAFVFPFDLSRSGLSTAIQAATRALQERGYTASVYITEEDAAVRGRTVLGQLIESDIAGVAYYPKTSDIHQTLLDRLVFAGRPVVVIDLPVSCRYISSVSSDNYGGNEMLMEHLLSLGHRRIAYVSGLQPEARRTLCDRFDAYVLAMDRAGLRVDHNLIITTLTEESRRSPGENGARTQVHDTVQALVARGATAALCEHDQLAFELVMACQELGVQVPEQLSVCGFDNSEWANILPGGITTVAQDMDMVGRRTAELLLSGLDAPLSSAQRITVPTRLVLGGTTARASQGAQISAQATEGAVNREIMG